LAARLKHLVETGFLTATPDPNHKQRTIYSLTEQAIDLVPIFAHLGAWGVKYRPVSRELAARAIALEEGGPSMWRAFMDELRHLHLGAPAPKRKVLQELQAAYESAVAEGEAVA
jgi:Predicted transcriptional regulators